MDNTIDIYYQYSQSLPGSQEVRSSLTIGRKMDQLQKRIDAIVLRITLYNDFKGKYKFFVFQSNDTQVLHTQDRKIYIPTGLVKMAKNDDQLAFILNHEIAHWENQDIRDNKVPIYRSPGQISEAECLADKKAIEATTVAQYKKQEIDALLQSIKGNRPICEYDEIAKAE